MSGTKGNTNALKHGLYARHFTPEERLGLRKMKPEDCTHVMYMLNVVIKDLFVQHILERESLSRQRAEGQPVDLEALTKLDNSLALAITALNGTRRTHALFNGTNSAVNDAYDEALNNLDIFKRKSVLIDAQAQEQVEEVWVEEPQPVE